jgi:type I site-specific restriction endonuclease
MRRPWWAVKDRAPRRDAGETADHPGYSVCALNLFKELTTVTETPEQKARREIDGKLIASGWLVQDRDDLDLTAGRGIAVREFPMKSGFGFADCLPFLFESNGSVTFFTNGLDPKPRSRKVFSFPRP